MSHRELGIVVGLVAIGVGCLLAALGVWLWWRWTAPATQTLIEERPAEREPVDLAAVEAALAEPELPPILPLRTDEERAEVDEKTAWLAEVRELRESERELERARKCKLEEQTIAIDSAALAELFHRQDNEEGEAYVRELRARLSATFAIVETTGPMAEVLGRAGR